jgi:TonB family protein
VLNQLLTSGSRVDVPAFGGSAPLTWRWASQMNLLRASVLLAILFLAGCASREVAPSSQEIWAQRYAEAYAKGRTYEEVQKGFAKLYPTFEALFHANGVQEKGKVVVSFTVEPDGSASNIQIVSSSFDAPLSGAVVEVVSRSDFGARNVPAFRVPKYPVVYTPPASDAQPTVQGPTSPPSAEPRP